MAGGGKKAPLPECRFGLSCYRKNVKHFDEYSHPCKYGAACYRRDPDHFHKYTHPKASKTTTAVAVAAAKAIADDDDDARVSDGSDSDGDARRRGKTTAKRKAGGVSDEDDDDDDSDDRGDAPAARRKPKIAKAARKAASDSGSSDSDSDGSGSKTSAATASSIRDLKVVFTGTFESGIRRVVENEASKLGAIVGSSVSSKTDLLVIGGLVRPFGAKEDRASDLGVRVIFEKEWNDMVFAEYRRRRTAKGATSTKKAHKKEKKATPHRDADDDDDDEDDDEDDNVDGNEDEDEDDDDGNGDDDDADADADTPKPLHKLEDGESVDYTSPSGSSYKIKRTGDHYYCTCPAWRNQSAPVNARTCKHLCAYLGDAFEKARVGGVKTVPLKARGTPKPDLLLAQRWEARVDPTDWHMSEKLDGVRAYWNGKELLSRLGNAFAAPSWFTGTLPRDMTLDGELFMGRGRFNDTVSVVRTVGSKRWTDVTYQVFDCPSEGARVFEERVEALQRWHSAQPSGHVKHVSLVQHTRVRDVKHMEDELERVVARLGGEGLMLRQPKSTYAKTRSSTLLKVKRFYDAEARVLAHVPGKGRHKGAMGALEVEMECGKKFKIGTGFSDAQRRSPPKVGAIITYKFQELTPDGIPRFAAFVGERADAAGPKDYIPKRTSA
ncbi:DNA ligase [Salpingoeca rosetta]|uniref:DNA ligase n=1 Tax=Salpingoeca rosetta (strain ATCC 50818 / BSB-021) TaxID=946362 RepID=F2UAM4_SALR5|nr:DNA ligase [Salpingoeca rosetta]EGD73440.1 DNA ligase [Salpingoeca rosetta]|eukprot:XP_004993722.1 DNA ligase [Salpingoeca rosetta]